MVGPVMLAEVLSITVTMMAIANAGRCYQDLPMIIRKKIAPSAQSATWRESDRQTGLNWQKVCSGQRMLRQPAPLACMCHSPSGEFDCNPCVSHGAEL